MCQLEGNTFYTLDIAQYLEYNVTMNIFHCHLLYWWYPFFLKSVTAYNVQDESYVSSSYKKRTILMLPYEHMGCNGSGIKMTFTFHVYHACQHGLHIQQTHHSFSSFV